MTISEHFISADQNPVLVGLFQGLSETRQRPAQAVDWRVSHDLFSTAFGITCLRGVQQTYLEAPVRVLQNSVSG